MNKHGLWQRCDWTLLNYHQSRQGSSVTQWSVPLHQAHIPLMALAAGPIRTALKVLFNMQLYSDMQL